MNSALERAVAELRQRRPILLVDDAAKPATGYLMAPAATITAEDICLMANYARGVVCAAVADSRVHELGLSRMTPGRSEATLDFTVSVEARQGVTTGISAADRARTLRTLATTTQPRVDLVTPGHIFPIRAKSGGVLVRNAPAEAAVDLLTLANETPVAALCAVLDEDGSIAGAAYLAELASELGLAVIDLSDLTRYRFSTESIIEKVAQSRLPTKEAGEFEAICFRSRTDGAEHLALVKGELAERGSDGELLPVLARVQAENPLGDLFGAPAAGSRDRLHAAMRKIDAAGRGVLVYVRHPRRGALRKQAAALAAPVESAPPARPLREFGIGAQILHFLGAKRIVLLTNTATDVAGIDAFQLEIVGRECF